MNTSKPRPPLSERDCRNIQLADILAPAVGWLLSLIGLFLLIARAARHGNAWQVTSCAIYGVCLVISYATFTFYHLYKYHPRWGNLFKILDHTTIYLLIAGTYTPFTLVYLRGHWGWTLFAAVWVLAVLGIVFKSFFVHRFKTFSTLIYLAMGWQLILAVKPALALIPAGGFWLLLAGGLCYSGGLVFYVWDRLLFHHAVWHLFVLAGSICHYLAIYWYVVPLTAT